MIKPLTKNSYEKFSKFAINVLVQVEQHTPIENIQVKKRAAQEIKDFLYQCAEHGYLDCVDFYMDGNLNPHFEFVNGLTIDGYRFLNELYADSVQKSAKKANFFSITSLIISVLTLLLSLYSTL